MESPKQIGSGTPKIKPEAVTKPSQLAAAALVAIAAIDTSFFGAAFVLTSPPWLRPFLAASAVCLTVGSLWGVYRLMTTHRNALQDDAHYSKGLARRNKEMVDRVEQLSVEIDQGRQLADQRLDLTQRYFNSVTAKMGLKHEERFRLSRALRESVQAGEDRVSQEMANIFVRDAQRVMIGSHDHPGDQLSALLNTVITSRYEKTLSAYDELVRQDVRPIDLVEDLHRVVAVLISERAVVKAPNPPVLIQATPGIVEVVLREVLSNAAAYSPASSNIEIDVSLADLMIAVVITNELLPGVIVSPDWLKPSVRGAASWQQYTSGAGLGLPLVERVLLLIGGSVELQQVDRRFRLVLQFRRG